MLTAEHRGRDLREPTGEPETLWGKMKGKMGDRVQYSKPEGADGKKDKKAKKRDTDVDGAMPSAKKSRKGGPGLTVLDLDTAGMYRPRTKETRDAYEALLSAIHETFGDQPQEVSYTHTHCVPLLCSLPQRAVADLSRRRKRRGGGGPCAAPLCVALPPPPPSRLPASLLSHPHPSRCSPTAATDAPYTPQTTLPPPPQRPYTTCLYTPSYLCALLARPAARQVLRGAAEEVLVVLKNDRLRDPERQKEVSELLGPVPGEKFAQLVAIGKLITDFSTEGNAKKTNP